MNEEKIIIKVGDLAKLSIVPIGTSGVIHLVSGQGRLRRRLLDMGLTPGAEVFLRKQAPLGDPLELTLRGYELSIRKSEADLIVIRVTDLDAKGDK
ncbi:MAG TPA: FeoA family protein [Bacilli bacterium]|jgi:Fe2+ transport system protein FeoA|nr:FeoA family protein [Bacilli bacterium]HOQ70856.1 FeoA family protein [Bacilli bacterium]HPK28742.1 FeoA family protein [Bacilli bacterium]